MAESAKVHGYRFPPTRLLATQYCGIIPDKSRQLSSVRELDSELGERDEEEGRGLAEEDHAHPIKLPPAPQSHTTAHHHTVTNTGLKWSQKLDALKEKLTNEITALERSLYIQQRQLRHTLPGVRTLINATKENTCQTAQVIVASCDFKCCNVETV